MNNIFKLRINNDEVLKEIEGTFYLENNKDKFDREAKKKIEEALNYNLSTIRKNLYGF